jgi:DNA-binding response OmpR family regulator
MGDKVLVVEDEPTLLETLEYNLARQGYEVYTATDGLMALCRVLRWEMSVLILMLTAWADEVDKVVGLEVFRQLWDGLRQEVVTLPGGDGGFNRKGRIL